MSAELACPLCRTRVAEGEEIQPGACPGCGARFVGGTEAAEGAAEAALAAVGLPPERAGALLRGLFALTPEEEAAAGAAVTSDRREGFYRWWVFLPAGDAPAAEVIRKLASEG